MKMFVFQKKKKKVAKLYPPKLTWHESQKHFKEIKLKSHLNTCLSLSLNKLKINNKKKRDENN